MDHGTAALERLRGRLRVRGGLLAFVGMNIMAWTLVFGSSGPAAILAFGGLLVALYGLASLVALPRYLRRPQHIADVRRIPTDPRVLLIVMEDEGVYELKVRADERESLASALETARNAARVPARLLQR
jgi:hypothetical protein